MYSGGDGDHGRGDGGKSGRGGGGSGGGDRAAAAVVEAAAVEGATVVEEAVGATVGARIAVLVGGGAALDVAAAVRQRP